METIVNLRIIEVWSQRVMKEGVVEDENTTATPRRLDHLTTYYDRYAHYIDTL
jgi:hypothetical protein